MESVFVLHSVLLILVTSPVSLPQDLIGGRCSRIRPLPSGRGVVFWHSRANSSFLLRRPQAR
uniref:Uncharacterized protein n=1 Tax=uncultured marine virus TaxID=186617 RepID=A0A0F7L654_9VIRU|nr:hypothetical protein [uncultured marine virus]